MEVHHAVHADIEIASSYNKLCEDTGTAAADPSEGNELLLQVQNSHFASRDDELKACRGMKNFDWACPVTSPLVGFLLCSWELNVTQMHP